MSLAELFPDGDYRFHLTLRRVEPRDFFAPRDPTGRILAERARWLDAEPGRYAAMLPEGEPLMREFMRWMTEWGLAGAKAEPAGAVTGENEKQGRAEDAIERLGRSVEPDLLFLSADDAGPFRLRGGALCFPTGWALGEKLGHPLDFIHGVVPGLNAALGASIQQFLSRLKPGMAYLRDNWGLTANEELNQHPARALPPPRPPVRLENLWLRVEQQALVLLPESSGILFGIRIALHRLDTWRSDPAWLGFRRALASMPQELAVYKRIEDIRDDLVNWV